MGSLDGSSAQEEPTGIISSFLRLAEAPNQAAFCWDAVRDVVWLSPGFARIFASPQEAPPLELWLRSFVPSKDALERALSSLRQLEGQMSKLTIGVEMASGKGPGSACVSGEASVGPDGGRVVLGTARLLLPGVDERLRGSQQGSMPMPIGDSSSQLHALAAQDNSRLSLGLGSALVSSRGLSIPSSSMSAHAEGSLSLRQWHQHMEGSGMTPNSVPGGRVGLQGHAKASASLHYSLTGGSRDGTAAIRGAEGSNARQGAHPRRWSDTQAHTPSPLPGASSLLLLHTAVGARGITRQAPRRLSQTQAEDSSNPPTVAPTASSSSSMPLRIIIAVTKDAEGNTLQRTAAKVGKRMTKQEPRIVRAQGPEAVAAACDDGADILLIDCADAGDTVAAIRQWRPPGTLPIVGLVDSSYCRRASIGDDDEDDKVVSALSAFDDVATKPLSAAVLTSLFGKHVTRLSKVKEDALPQEQPPRFPASPNNSEAAAATSADAIRRAASATLAFADVADATAPEWVRRPPAAAAANKASDRCASSRAASRAAGGDASAAAGAPPTKVANILIADDSAANQMALKRVVRKVGREVLGAEPNIRTAGDGSEALQAAQQTRFDLVFMDIHMPVMNGIEALHGIRERYTDTEMPVVAVSGTDEAAGPGLSSAGFNEVVFKPISTTRVKTIIQKFTGAGAASGATPPSTDAAAAAAPSARVAAPAAATTQEANADVTRKRIRAEGGAPGASAGAPGGAAGAAEAPSPKVARRDDTALPSPVAPGSSSLPSGAPLSSSASGAQQERQQSQQQQQPQWLMYTEAAKTRPATPKPTSISATEAYAPVSYTPISEFPVKRIQRLLPHSQCSDCGETCIQGPSSVSMGQLRFLVVGASIENLSRLEERIQRTVVEDLGGPQPLVESVVATDEALAATHAHHVDIVFVDLNRPTAGAVVAELRRAFNIASLPIVGLVTQRGDAKRTQEITSELISLQGLNEVDLKPVPRGRIRQIIIENLSCCKHLRPQLFPTPALAPPPRNKARITCLVAEDDQTAMRMAKRILQKANIEVMEARNGFEAVAAVTGYLQGSLDIVLMDCNMPIKDGWQATRAIRAWEAEHNAPAIPVVAVTANVLEEARGSCLAAGMNEYLAKPVNKLLLLETISRMTGFDHSCAASAVSAVSLPAAAASSAGATGTGTTTESELTTASRFLSAFGSSTSQTVATGGTLSSKNSASGLVTVLETERVSAVAPAGRSCGMLLVDEELERLLRNKVALEAAGVTVDTAEGGAQALLKLRAGDTAYTAVMVASDLALATGAEETAIEASQGPHDPPRLILLRETRPRPDLRAGANPEQQRRAPEEAAGLWFRILDLPLKRQGLCGVLADCGLPAPYLSPSGNDHEELLPMPETWGGPCHQQQLRSLSKLRILYVDDSEAMRGAVLWMLHAEGLVLAQAMGVLDLFNGQGLPLPGGSGSSSLGGCSEKFSAVVLNAGDSGTAALCAEALKVAQPGILVVAVQGPAWSSSPIPGINKVISGDCFGPAAVMEAIHGVVRAGAGTGTTSSLPEGVLEGNRGGGDDSLRPPVADVGAALHEFEDDWEFVLSLLQCFVSNGYEQVSGLVEASFSKPMNLVRLKHLAHMLSGAAASCRILSIAAVCRQLEKLAVERMQEVADGRNSRGQHILVLASTTQRLFLEVAVFYSWLKGLQSINVESGLEHTGGNYAHFVKSVDEIAGAATELLVHPDEKQAEQQNRAAVVCLLEESSPLMKAAAPHLSAAVESYKQQKSEPVWQELSRELRSLREEVRGLLYNRPPTR